MIRPSALKGYLLEEILAYLIKNTGYRLLVDPLQDQRELAWRGSGLVVQGRGGVHQADVLGQLMWIPAFTFPIRLFVEAKCTTNKTGISIIRNAVGVVDDINQNYAPIREGSDRLIRRFAYRYALFSTAGFTKHSVDYAMAHQISLIDLSGPDFWDLRELVNRLGSSLHEFMSTQSEERGVSQKNLMKRVRIHIRRSLGTWPQGVPPEPDLSDSDNVNLQASFPNFFNSFNDRLRTGADRIGEIFVGMASGPFLLALRPQNSDEFLQYVETNPAHKVIITWSRSDQRGRRWTVRPADNPQAYSLTFGLPERLGDWIFSKESGAQARALSAKSRFMKEIMIYRYIDGRDYLYRLSYDSEETQGFLNQ